MRFVDELSVTPLADGRTWRLNSDFRYESDMLVVELTVPRFFLTDFTSSPEELYSVIPPWQRYGSAAVLHDWLYWIQDTDRETADAVLREAMTALAVDETTIHRIYTAVRAFGGFAWARNQRLRASGYTRMASGNSNPPYAGI